ncbi:hypothetical protein [Corynebacterium sp. AOP12-C2-36]|uniref:hypothetical protein n=1 Tax=Corynebacterium sp. AOP12-C2-36 TaxID=3457723 RepID=UPI0040344859
MVINYLLSSIVALSIAATLGIVIRAFSISPARRIAALPPSEPSGDRLWNRDGSLREGIAWLRLDLESQTLTQYEKGYFRLMLGALLAIAITTVYVLAPYPEVLGEAKDSFETYNLFRDLRQNEMYMGLMVGLMLGFLISRYCRIGPRRVEDSEIRRFQIYSNKAMGLRYFGGETTRQHETSKRIEWNHSDAQAVRYVRSQLSVHYGVLPLVRFSYFWLVLAPPSAMIMSFYIERANYFDVDLSDMPYWRIPCTISILAAMAFLFTAFRFVMLFWQRGDQEYSIKDYFLYLAKKS